jgi:hypothetical protein
MGKILLFGILIFFAGCTIPAEVFFRNFSNDTVRLRATLANRRFFDKLPNKVQLYDTAAKRREFYGTWKYNELVTWVDTSTFCIDIPAFTVINVADISRGLVLGAREPNVLLVMIKAGKADTIMKGDYLSLANAFKSTGYGLFKKPVYYYDVR